MAEVEPGQSSESTMQTDTTKRDSSILDLAFAMDCTGSMGSYIQTARDNIRKIAEDITAAEKSDIRYALVEYRDHPPEESTFVTRVTEFTPSLTKMRTALEKCSADGGGDFPEAVADALHCLTKLNWRANSTRIVVFIADAPPHGLARNDSFPTGCPEGLDPLIITKKLAEMAVTIYMVGCEPSIRPYKDFMMILSYITGGQYVPLGAAALLTQIIIGGAREELSLEKFMDEVQEDVDDEAGEEELVEKFYSKMKSKGVRSKHVKMDQKSLPEASENAKKWSSYESLAKVRKEFINTVSEDSEEDECEFLDDDWSSEEKATPGSASGIKKRSRGLFGLFEKKKHKLGVRGRGGGVRSRRSVDMEDECEDQCQEYCAKGSRVDVEEEEISISQVRRMVKKGKARSAFK